MHDAFVESDQRRIEDVYRQESPRMWRALLGFAGDPDVATDARAEAFARALREGDAIRDPVAWVWRVSFRLAAAELRRRRGPSPLPAPVSYEMPDPVSDLVKALRRLTPNQRMAVVLHDGPADLGGAESLGCSRATVHVHLSQGRCRLRHILEGE